MSVAVLTTDTLHHTFFVRELAKHVPVARVFVETEHALPRFPVHRPFEDVRKQFERDRWFDGASTSLADYADVSSYPSLNDKEAQLELSSLGPDLVFVYGTGRLSTETIDCCCGDLVNFHGGDPERYRGLDSFLWAIYHRDFQSFVVTLHRVNAGLDDGDIVLQGVVPLDACSQLYELRALTAELCVEMATAATGMRDSVGKLISRRQRKKGRYYSFMPAELKSICEERFRHWLTRRKAPSA